MYSFILKISQYSEKKFATVKEAFEAKKGSEEVFVILNETGSRFRVIMP